MSEKSPFATDQDFVATIDAEHISGQISKALETAREGDEGRAQARADLETLKVAIESEAKSVTEREEMDREDKIAYLNELSQHVDALDKILRDELA